ncbi:hypothetical protein BDA96_07G192800 [Sorghum bicolor]|uniref:Uncharacterized protein n=2 Tax=Sorghum bicolor TaxID=4558 RepID=A0A921U9X7_SORBI|nr:hypothetical protein SORBI_3007G180800 [Sorghum bicolor]KAG0524232.1 hypothetical protein BDA96_07G192800 [Sorghum bicolor]
MPSIHGAPAARRTGTPEKKMPHVTCSSSVHRVPACLPFYMLAGPTTDDGAGERDWSERGYMPLCAVLCMPRRWTISDPGALGFVPALHPVALGPAWPGDSSADHGWKSLHLGCLINPWPWGGSKTTYPD